MRVRALPPGGSVGWVGPDHVVIGHDVGVPEILGRLRERGDPRGIVSDLLMRIHDADAHRRIMASVKLEHRRHNGPSAEPTVVEAAVRHEARDVHGWSNAAGDTYAEHEHGYTKIVYCTRGSI